MQTLILFVSAVVSIADAAPSPVVIETVPFGGLTAEIVNDSGRGPDGRKTAITRLRSVLPGLVYRAGRNALYMPYGQYKHPPTKWVLDSLCASGFRRVYFFYADPLPPPPVSCTIGRDSITVIYEHALVVHEVEAANKLAPARTGPSPMRNKQFPARDRVLATVYEAIKRDRRDPMLLQDRAGLHAAGYISAIILRQFCALDGPSAVEYWKATADRKGAVNYRVLLDEIEHFDPLPAYQIDRLEVQTVCPSPVR